MISNNKELQTEYESDFYVLLSRNEQGIKKYISKDFGKKDKFNFTIKLHKAKKFRNPDMAIRFIVKFNIRARVFKCCIKEYLDKDVYNNEEYTY